MSNQSIGYIRVSTQAQSTDRQLDGVAVDHVFIDRVSGASKDRPQLQAMLKHMRTGDTIHCHSIDRLARSLPDLIQLVETITDQGAQLRFHKEGLSFGGDSSPMQTLQLQLMGSIAEFERSLINERATEGRKLAQARGVKFGRRPTLTDADKKQIRDWRDAGKPIAWIARNLDTTRQTVYRALA